MPKLGCTKGGSMEVSGGKNYDLLRNVVIRFDLASKHEDLPTKNAATKQVKKKNTECIACYNVGL